jgi:hypothetical protein
MRMSAFRVFQAGAVAALASLAGCGGGNAGDINGIPTFGISGTVEGLESGGTVVIALGSQTQSLTSNGPFTFPGQIPDQTSYMLTAQTMPMGQTCGVLNGNGTISNTSPTNVEVYCTADVSAASLSGTYEIAALNINADSDQLFTAVPFDGNGTQGSSTVTTNQAGTTFTTSTDPGATYTVTTQEALPVLSFGTNNQGAIARDGDEFFAIAGDVSGGIPPVLSLGVKPLQTATLTSLTGNWISVALTQAATPYATEASIAIAGDGSFNGSQSTLDLTGAATAQTAISGPAGSYAVANDVVTLGGESGYISANGEFAVLTAVTQQPGGASANYPVITAAVKQGSGVTLATLNGVYSVGYLGFGTATTGNASLLTLYLDGAGNFSGTVVTNENGAYGSSSVTGTYTVTSSGVLTLTDVGGDVFNGGVSADGNIVVGAYLTASAGAPTILVGYRQ